MVFNPTALDRGVLDSKPAAAALIADGACQRIEPPFPTWLSRLVGIPLELFELQLLKVTAMGTFKMPMTLVSRPESGVHGITLGSWGGDQEPARVPKGPGSFEDHFQPAWWVVPHLIAEQPADRFGLKSGLGSRPSAIEPHSVEGEAGQGWFAHPCFDGSAVLKGRGKPIPDKVPEFIFRGCHPQSRAGVFADGPAGATNHRLSLG